MTRQRFINLMTFLLIAALWFAFTAWIIDKTVARDQERWERQTVGMASPRPSGGD
jgi:hypothetical protein